MRLRFLIATSLLWSACGGSTAPSDSGPAPDGSQPTACGPRIGGLLSGRHVLRFETADGSVKVLVQRDYMGPGVGESALFSLSGMWIDRGGSCLAITEPASLQYTNSHHNWLDAAIATTAGVEHTLSMTFDFIATAAWMITLHSSDGTPDASLITTGVPIDLNASPRGPGAWISEVMAVNDGAWRDDAGEADPWIEIANPASAAPFDLSGWFVSNDPRDRRRFSFAAGTSIPAGGRIVIAADGQPAQGPLHTAFRLSPNGSVVLTAPDGVTAGERDYPSVAAGQSAEFSHATDGFVPAAPSPGAGGF